ADEFGLGRRDGDALGKAFAFWRDVEDLDLVLYGRLDLAHRLLQSEVKAPIQEARVGVAEDLELLGLNLLFSAGEDDRQAGLEHARDPVGVDRVVIANQGVSSADQAGVAAVAVDPLTVGPDGNARSLARGDLGD